MKAKRKTVLFLEDTLDFKHLKYIFDEYDIDTTFENKKENLYSLCNELKYDLLVVSLVNNFNILEEISSNLRSGINSNTPIISVVDNNSFPTAEELTKSNTYPITFPFAPAEILFRIQQIFRNSVTEQYIDSSLSDYKKIIDSMPVGFVQTDSRGKFLKINKRFLEIMDMSDLDVRKENFFQLCHPDDYFLERKQLDRLLKKDLARINYEIRLINNGGKTIVSSVSAGAVWSDDGHFSSFLFIIETIT